jgi:hypothetical protein
MKKWTPRSAFGSSVALDSGDDPERGVRAFSCGNGYYLLTNSTFGENDPVFAVAWAASGYWIERIWFGYHMDLDLHPGESQVDPPSLEFLGRPTDLTYEAVLQCERRLKGRSVIVNAAYRFGDGAFTSHQVSGADRVTYYFDSPNPKNADHPVAIEFRLAKDG